MPAKLLASSREIRLFCYRYYLSNHLIFQKSVLIENGLHTYWCFFKVPMYNDKLKVITKLRPYAHLCSDGLMKNRFRSAFFFIFKLCEKQMHGGTFMNVKVNSAWLLDFNQMKKVDAIFCCYYNSIWVSCFSWSFNLNLRKFWPFFRKKIMA